jgi:tetratricopeptide (TPR) repeat protein
MTNRTRPSTLLPLLLPLLAGCASTSITLQSSPSGATVFAKPMAGGEARQLGETPLTLKAADIQKGSFGPVYFEFRKEGHASAKTLVTDLSAQELLISQELAPATGLESMERLNAVLDRVFECQRLARAGRLDDALRRLKELEAEAPQLAAVYELEGGIYYLQKKYAEAYDAYGLAAKHNPGNPEPQRMRSLLAATLGLSDRVPARAPSAGDPKGR